MADLDKNHTQAADAQLHVGQIKIVLNIGQDTVAPGLAHSTIYFLSVWLQCESNQMFTVKVLKFSGKWFAYLYDSYMFQV